MCARNDSRESGEKRMKGNGAKLAVVLVLASVVIAFFALGLQEYLTFEYLKSSRERFQAHYGQHGPATMGAFFIVYVLVSSLSLPGAAVMTLAGGAMFGLGVGLLLVSFASTIGATLAFLVARFLLKDHVQSKFGDRLQAINQGIQRDGPFYLFTLRLVPLFPFFVINLIMGLTPLRTGTFYVISQIGMLPGTLVYVNAGTQLGKIESLKDIMSPELLLSFALLGLFPLIARKTVPLVMARVRGPRGG